MKKLDRSRPFGTIHGGSPVPGALYEQDGEFFNAAGDSLSTVKGLPKESTQAESLPMEPSKESVILAMAKQGMSVPEIAKANGIHHMKVNKGLRDAGF